jgi:hypothetical protein
VKVDTVKLVDLRGHVVQHAYGAAGRELGSHFAFDALIPGRYTLETRAEGRTWAQPVRVPVGKHIQSDITIGPK